MIDWNKQPYRSANVAVGYNKKEALKMIRLAKEISGDGFIDEDREPKLVRNE